MEQKRRFSIGSFLGLDDTGTFGILLALFWTFTTLPYYARGVIVRLMGSGVEEYVIPFFFIVAAILCLRTIIKATRFWDYAFMIALVLFFLGCYSWFPQNKPYLEEYEESFLYWSLPFFIVGITTSFRKCQRLLYVFSVLAIFLQLLFLLANGISVKDQGEKEAFGLAYGILPAVLFMIWKAFEDKTLLSITIAIIGILNVVFMGTRGPILVIAEFIVLFLLFFCHFEHPIRARFIIAFLSVPIFLLFENILELLMDLSISLGFSDRALEVFSNSDNLSELLLESSGRDVIYENLIDAIGKAPFWGYGPGADHIYSDFYEAYAHNIILEMLIEYGLIPGAVILLSILALIVIAFKKCKDHDTMIFLLVCVTFGFLGLMTSGVYWTSREFFFMLGVCVSVIRNNKGNLPVRK